MGSGEDTVGGTLIIIVGINMSSWKTTLSYRCRSVVGFCGADTEHTVTRIRNYLGVDNRLDLLQAVISLRCPLFTPIMVRRSINVCPNDRGKSLPTDTFRCRWGQTTQNR